MLLCNGEIFVINIGSSYSVYFEIKHQQWSICVSLLSTCVCKILLKKVPLVIEISAKQHSGSFYGTPGRSTMHAFILKYFFQVNVCTVYG